MRAIILFLGMILFSRAAISQNSKEFIYLFSEKKIESNNIKIVEKTFSNNYFVVDAKEFKSEEVAFYKNEKGFFANIKNLSLFGGSAYAQREVTGKINLFSKEFTTNSMIMGPNGMMMGGFGTNTSVSYYYNKGEFGVLKKTNFNNLKIDLNDNPNSIIHLNKYKSISQRGTILYVVGGIIATVGLATFINKTANVPSDEVTGLGGSYAALGVGFGTILVNYFTTKDKQKYIEKAIEVYNE